MGTRLDRGRLARMRARRPRSAVKRSGIPHLTPALSAPGGGEGALVDRPSRHPPAIGALERSSFHAAADATRDCVRCAPRTCFCWRRSGGIRALVARRVPEASGMGIGDLQLEDEPVDVAFVAIARDQRLHPSDCWASHAARSGRVGGDKDLVGDLQFRCIGDRGKPGGGLRAEAHDPRAGRVDIGAAAPPGLQGLAATRTDRRAGPQIDPVDDRAGPGARQPAFKSAEQGPPPRRAGGARNRSSRPPGCRSRRPAPAAPPRPA